MVIGNFSAIVPLGFAICMSFARLCRQIISGVDHWYDTFLCHCARVNTKLYPKRKMNRTGSDEKEKGCLRSEVKARLFSRQIARRSTYSITPSIAFSTCSSSQVLKRRQTPHSVLMDFGTGMILCGMDCFNKIFSAFITAVTFLNKRMRYVLPASVSFTGIRFFPQKKARWRYRTYLKRFRQRFFL